jgi:Mandelate racemase / muconate lactonizing enzyme, N-terminal domain
VTRISYAKTYQVAYPLDVPLSDSIHYMPLRAALLVELGTDDGEVGIGESAIYGGPASVVETMIHDELAPRIRLFGSWSRSARPRHARAVRLRRSGLPHLSRRQPDADDVGPLLPGRRAPRGASAPGRGAVTLWEVQRGTLR